MLAKAFEALRVVPYNFIGNSVKYFWPSEVKSQSLEEQNSVCVYVYLFVGR